jgi:hypothetical protein
MTITPQQAQTLVDELVTKNKVGDQFTHNVPDDWPIEAWRLLLKAECECWDTENLHCWIAGHVYAPEEIVRTLAQSPVRRVRWRVAEKRNLPKDLFAVMAKDDSEGVRQCIACNKKAPLEVIESLKNDPAETVRRLVKNRLAVK